MRLIPLTSIALLALGALAGACDSGGGTGGTAASQQTLFDDFFGSGGGGASADANTATAGAGEERDCTEQGCEPADPQTPEHGGVVVSEGPSCQAPHPTPSGAADACTAFCGKVAGCLGQPAAAAACAADCGATLGGTNVTAAGQIFECFVAAECDDVLAWHGGGSQTAEGHSGGEVPPPEPATDVPGAPAEEGGNDAGSGAGSEGSSGNGSSDAGDGPDEAEPVMPPSYEPNPIAVCIDRTLQAFGEAALPASKQALCDAVVASEDRCDGGASTAPSSGASEGSSGGEGSAGSDTPSTPPSIPAEDGAPEDEAPPEVPADDPWEEEDSDGGQAACAAIVTMMSDAAVRRISVCEAMDDCDARSDCFEAEVACLPFFETFFGLSGSGGGSSTTTDVAVVEPEETEPAEAEREE